MTDLENVIRLCRYSYPRHNFEGHILPVVKASLELCEKFRADRRIVEPAAYLHDIGRVLVPFVRAHEVTGYHISRAVLVLTDYTPQDRKRICEAVLAHRGNEGKHKPKNIEEEIISNADAIAQFEQWPYLLAIHYSCHGKNLASTKRWVAWKLKHSYDTKLTLPGSKERIEKRYNSALIELCTNNPSISFVVIGRNHPTELDRCLRSIKAQDYCPSEMIYVDNSDSDESVNIAKGHGVDAHQPENRGANASRNYGARQAKGDILVFIDGNDELEKDAAYNISQAVQSGTKIGALRWASKEFSLKDWATQTILNMATYKAWPACFMTREAYQLSGGFDESGRIYVNDVAELAAKIKYTYPSERIDAKIYGNMDGFRKHGYLKRIMDWLK